MQLPSATQTIHGNTSGGMMPPLLLSAAPHADTAAAVTVCSGLQAIAVARVDGALVAPACA